jgi:predicted DNA-binding antitoxin AbrB/MazE fold protein
MELVMVSIKGTFNNGVVHPLEAIAAREGQQVIITLVEQENPSEDLEGSDWEELNQILADCQVDTGIEDLAHQHDHYIHGTPKREAYP